MEATTAAVEAPTTTKSTTMEAASAHSASVSTAAATSVTAAAAAAATATAATAATSECHSWLNQAHRCQCEQGYNRFSHYAFPPVDEVAPKAYNTFVAGLFGGRRALAVN
jgi:hypothetical protein